MSKDSESVISALGYRGRVSKIPLGYDPDLFSRNEILRKAIRDRLRLRETTVAYFGRITPEKGAHLLIEALAQIKELPWRLLLDRFDAYASSYKKKLERLIEEKELSSRIVYFDAKHGEIPAYMNAADIVVVPSLSMPHWKEQYGRVVPEAMACGRLVIASDCGALPELVGQAGLIFPEKNIKKLAELLRTALSNPEMREKLGFLAEERASALLSTTKQRDLMNEVFRKFVSPCRAELNSASTLLPISAIVPTRNRSVSLGRMLNSLAHESAQPIEMVVVDASTNEETRQLCENKFPGLATRIIYHHAAKVGAAAQRNQAIQYASQETIWFIDDDVIFEPDCLMRLWSALQSDSRLGGVSAMTINQRYSPPGLASRLLFQFLHGRAEASYAGKCIGPAFNLLPEDCPDLPKVVPVEWLHTTCSLYRREALPNPLFSDHFTGYSMMEDVALSLVVGRRWRLANARTARIFHDSQGGDYKDNAAELSEMKLVNRHYVMTQILKRKKGGDYLKLFTLETFELLSSLTSIGGCKSLPAVVKGKLMAFWRILKSSQDHRRDTEPAKNICALRHFLSRLTHHFLSRTWHRWHQLVRAFKDSIFFAPNELAECLFTRYVNYRQLERWLAINFPSLDRSFKVIEFGGSNSAIKNILKKTSYEVAANFPDVDIQNLAPYLDENYDAVVIDNVLEHVPRPDLAVDEIWRVLKKDGLCICITPFLIQVHFVPGDYFRYTEAGLRQLFRKFRKIEINGWGNRFTVETTLYHGWLTAKNTKRFFRVALWNEPDWPLHYLTIATK